MKKRVVLYTIYCCIVIIVLASFLVFKLNKDDDIEPASRAESIMLNTPRELTITTNKKIQLLDGFISVEPANAMDLLTYSITASATTSTDYFDFDFKNKTFSARKTGYYCIKFEVPKNAYSSLSDTLKIHAIAETKQDFALETNQITLGKTVKFEQIFKQNSPFNFDVVLENDNLIYADNCFYANKEGITKVSITITRDFISYTNEYDIHIEKDYTIPSDPDEKDPDDDKEQSGGNENLGGDNNPSEQPGGEHSGGESGGDIDDNTGETGKGDEGNTGNEGNTDEKDEPGDNEGGDSGNTGGDSGDVGGDVGSEDKDDNKDDNQSGGQGSGEQSGGEIKPQPQEKYEIHVDEMDFNNLTNSYTVQFEVLLGENQYVSQKLKATINDPTMAEIIDCTPPLIYIKILKSGTFTLTLTLVDNPEVSISVEISVVLENEKT